MDQFKTNKRSCPKFGLFGPNKIYANNSQLGPMYNNTKKYNKYSWAHSPIPILQKKKKRRKKNIFSPNAADRNSALARCHLSTSQFAVSPLS